MQEQKDLLGYEKIEKYSPENLNKLEYHYNEILKIDQNKKLLFSKKINE